MRARTILTTALLTAALLAAGPAAAPPPAAARGADCYGFLDVYCVPALPGAPGAWVLVDTEKTVDARFYRLRRMPAEEVDGARIQLRTRPAGGGAWTVADRGVLAPDPDQSQTYRAPLTFRFPRTGVVETQVRTFLDGRWFAGRPARHVVTAGSGRHDPTGLDPSVQSGSLTLDADLTRAAWWSVFEFAETYYTADPYDLEARLPSLSGLDPEWADDVDSFVVSRLVFSGEDPVGTRVVLVDRVSQRSVPVAYLEDGGRAPFSGQPSTSDDARWVAYTSTSREIVSPSPEGRKVFLADTRDGSGGRSALLGLGARPSVSGNGTFVAYLRPDGRVARYNRLTGGTRVVTARAPHDLGSLAVTDDGSVVWSQRAGDGARRVVLRLAGSGSRTVVGEGTSPVVTDDARFVAFAGGRRYPDGGYGGVRRFDTRTGRTEVVATGPGGRPSTTRIAALEMDATGRYVVAAPDGGFPLMPGSSGYRVVRFDLDAR